MTAIQATPPNWLQRHLEAIGAANTDGFTIRPRAGHCRKCQGPVIRALDDTICGLPVTCDPQPLNAHGELWARQAGRATYTLRIQADDWRIDRRNALDIVSKPPTKESRRYDVLAAHQCGNAPHELLTTIPATTKQRTAEQPTEPPY